MTNLQFITLILIANLALMVFTILKTRRLSLHMDSRILIYVLAVTAPIFGFILYLIRSNRLSKS